MKSRLFFGIALVLFGFFPLTAQVADDSRDQKIDKIVDFFDKFDLVGLVRFRAEKKDNYDFDKNSTICETTPGTVNTLTGAEATKKTVICTDSNDNKEFVGQKVQLGFKFNGDTIKSKVILQDSRVWGGEPGSESGLNTANSNTNQSTDVREAWIEFALFDELGLQAGRQTLVYGDQRLLGHLDWTNVGRSFDGLRFKLKTGILDSHLFGMVLGEEDSDAAGNNTSQTEDNYMSGWYNILKFSDDFHTDLYYIGIHKKWKQSAFPQYLRTEGRTPIQQIPTEDKSRGRDNLYTFGIRLHNKTKKGQKAPGPVDWTLEYAHQQGQTGEQIAASWDVADVVLENQDTTLFDASNNPCRVYATSSVTGKKGCKVYLEKRIYDAFAGAATAGYTINSKYRIGAEYAVAGGDPDRTDGSVATFNNLKHTNHLHYGQADQVSWQNMTGKSINFTINMDQYGKLKFAYWEVDKFKLQDAWYGVTGSKASTTTTESNSNQKFATTYGTSSSNWNELDSLASAYLKKHLFKEYDVSYGVKLGEVQLGLGYSLVVAGDAIEAPKSDYAVLYQTFFHDLADGDLDNPATLLKFNRTTFDREAHFAYVQMTYKF